MCHRRRNQAVLWILPSRNHDIIPVRERAQRLVLVQLRAEDTRHTHVHHARILWVREVPAAQKLGRAIVIRDALALREVRVHHVRKTRIVNLTGGRGSLESGNVAVTFKVCLGDCI